MTQTTNIEQCIGALLAGMSISVNARDCQRGEPLSSGVF
jgi:hypothetical protein